MIKPLVFTMIIDSYIDLIIYLPTPSIIVHGAKIDIATVRKVDFRVQEPLFRLVNLNSSKN